MTASRLGVLAALVAVASGPSLEAAQTAAAPAVVTARSAARVPRAVVPAVRGTLVFGYLWAADSTPIPDGRLRLRIVTSGRIEATTVSDAGGEFTFENLEGGTYVIEYVNAKGRILAVGQVFSLAPGQTVATFIRLGTRLPWFGKLFGDTAAAAVTTAASLGVTAVAPTGLAATAGK